MNRGNSVVQAVERGVTALEICSDWACEVEMPDGWVATSDEVVSLRDTVDSVKRLEADKWALFEVLARLARAMSKPAHDAERANALLDAHYTLDLIRGAK